MRPKDALSVDGERRCSCPAALALRRKDTSDTSDVGDRIVAGRAGASEGYPAGMWLWSVPTAVALSGAVVGAVLTLALTNLSRPLAVVVGGAAGWFLSSLVLGAAAERLDRRLHQMGENPLRRRRH